MNRLWGGLRLHGATKTSNQAALFAEENRRILAGREVPGWKRRLNMLRRLGQMLGRGELGYVLRGMARRARASDKGAADCAASSACC